ncbi:class I SAM-dependent methyltransferase [Aurantiacibacter gangjinensis]|uniref:class I SAM-dependent methyltransferase n=1 Tax=Aurantiacibacter gangjinensis TaxID=502682 RepID=UPI00069BA16A|nr:class I SAM-dependent methyltransferase [Aurantiacibacter gangjinensis]APE28735.1 3-demethylubiquinol 3-O-methyltransferase [Aurantiacibacter gangjinensis]
MAHERKITATRIAVECCNLCGSTARTHLFTKHTYHLVRCDDCALAYIANPPDAEGIAAIYTTVANYHETLLDEATDGFSRQARVADQHLAMLRRFRHDLAGLRVLDVGCSSGIFLDRARKAGMEPFGAELSPETAAFARDHYELPVQTGDWREAGYAPESFDVITLFDVIEHLPDPKAELMALRGLLKAGGLLLQSTPDIEGLFPRLSGKLAMPLDYWPHPEPPHHLFQFSQATLSRMTEDAGYRMEAAHHTSIDLAYNFGTSESWRASPKMLAYAALFALVAIVGEWVGQGDWLYLGATRA